MGRHGSGGPWGTWGTKICEQGRSSERLRSGGLASDLFGTEHTTSEEARHLKTRVVIYVTRSEFM